MATSEFLGLIKGLPTNSGSLDNFPMRTSLARAIVNNVNHIADERGQVIASWFSGNALSPVVSSSFIDPNFSPPLFGYIRNFSFNNTVKNGVPYGLRIRIGGYSKLDTGQFNYLITDHLNIDLAAGSTVPFTSGSGTGSDPAWRDLAGTSPSYVKLNEVLNTRDELSVNLVGIPPALELYAYMPYNMLNLSIYASSSTGDPSDVVLTQLYIAEYVGL